ncbi:unnamed protein product [Blepharisma stoltei]|uniref:Uncharacterized protein n=1 Tax=Blepharisma stoltei TaxID=1481888 RepID=A0AAU9JIF5_9CILI|nr:unnamed protein product [Blepharisma stoltei]
MDLGKRLLTPELVEEREYRKALLLKAELETSLAEKDLASWKRNQSYQIERPNTYSPIFMYKRNDPYKPSPNLSQSIEKSDSSQKNSYIELENSGKKIENHREEGFKKKYEEICEIYKNETALYRDEIDRLNQIIEVGNKGVVESRKSDEKLLEKLKTKKEEVKELKQKLKEKERIKDKEFKELEMQTERIKNYVKTEMEMENKKNDANGTKAKRKLSQGNAILRPRSSEPSRISQQNRTLKTKNNTQSQPNIKQIAAAKEELQGLEEKKKEILEEIKNLEKERNKLNKPWKDVKAYYEERVKFLENELSNWRAKAIDLSTKYFSALKALKIEMRETKIQCSNHKRNSKKQFDDTVNQLKDHYESVISRLQKYCENLENKSKKKKKAKII